MPKRWLIQPHDAGRIAQLESRARIPAVLAQLLVGRGLNDPEAVREFLDPKLVGLRDPDQLPGVTAAADLLFDAAKRGRPVVVYGDYDADGMTATAILVRCLKLVGADVSYYLPDRMEEGYGLNDDALRKLAQRGAQVVVTVDCGITSLAQAETARELGLELIITDHHQFADRLPSAAAIVHPRLPGHSYPFSGLCGAGVAFKLAWALSQRASSSERVSRPLREFLITAVGMVAIATVADMVPLLDENRILVKHGLDSLKQQPPLGLAMLMKITQLDQKSVLGGEDIAFTLAPRLNAAGRLGQAQLGVELLMTESQQRAEALAEYIHELNSSRDSLERKVYLAAKKQAKEQFSPENDPALVLAGRGWHPGIIGIVAGRLADKFYRPVVILSLDELGSKPAGGSARSAGTLNLHEALSKCSHRLVTYGGHAAAAGLKINEDQIDNFRAEFCEYAAEAISSDDRDPTIQIDAETLLPSLTLSTVEQMERMAPFGQSNPRPVLCASDVQMAEKPKRMGAGDRHLSVRLKQSGVTFRAVAFGQGDWVDELADKSSLDIAFRPVINRFRGRCSVELQLVDWRPAESSATVAGTS